MKTCIAVLIPAVLLLTACKKTTTDDGVSARVVLGESFTNVFCSNCKVADAVLDSLEAERDDFVVVKYHAFFYNPNDPFAQVSQTPVEARQTYYWGSVNQGLPFVILDGIAEFQGIAEVATWGTFVEERQGTVNPVEIGVTGTYDPNFGTGELTIVITGTITGSPKLRVALVESELTFNNETYLFVLRDMFPSAAGIATDAPDTHQVDFQVDPGWDEDHLDLVIFVQDDSDREVNQAVKVSVSALGAPQTSFSVEHPDTLFSFAPTSLFEYHVTLTNEGTSQDVYVISLVDSLAPGWTSSICQGGVCLPPGKDVHDTLAAGEVDTTIVAEIFTDVQDTSAFTTLTIRSENDPGLVYEQRLWIGSTLLP
jgi:hypothetical protein